MRLLWEFDKGAELPGHNHFPWCTCGWCVGGGRAGHSQPTRVDIARERLRIHGVTGFTSCFVNHNARCPVCGDAVYFYSNSYGSRVYFNDLGPPWPKHECTDTPRMSEAGHFSKPTKRPRDQIDEILSFDLEAGTNYSNSRSKLIADWVLHVVVEAVFENGTLWIATESIADAERIRQNFHLHCSEKILDAGDFVSIRNKIFSFVRRDTLEAIDAIDGQAIGRVDDVSEPVPDPDQIPIDIDDLRPIERHNFQSAVLGRNDLIKKFRPILFSLAKRRIVGPNLVSHYLNESGHRTASGGLWTPRLAFFLISYTEAPSEKPPQLKRMSIGMGKVARHPPRHPSSSKTKRRQKEKGIMANPVLSMVESQWVEPVGSVDLPKLERELADVKTLMIKLQEERKEAWITERRRHAVTERFHAAKKKHDLLWDKIDRMKKR